MNINNQKTDEEIDARIEQLLEKGTELGGVDMLSEKKQEELAGTTLTGVSGGGMVEVTITGKKDITAIKINPQVVDPDDVEMLEDLVLGAIKDAQTKADNLSKDALGGFGL